MDIGAKMVEEVTNEWLEMFDKDVSAGVDLGKRVFWRMCLVCGLPAGVDVSDPRVIKAMEAIAESLNKVEDNT